MPEGLQAEAGLPSAPVAGARAAQVVAELEVRIGAVTDAASDWGVRPDHLEGRFLAAFLTALHGLGRLIVAAAVDLTNVVTMGKAAADAELLRLRAAQESAAALLQQARTAQVSLEVQRETLVARLVEHIGPQVASGVKDWVVIREKEHNRKAARTRAAFTVAAALALVACGYGVRVWQDEDATAALARCVARKLIVQVNGANQAYCSLDALLPGSSSGAARS